MFQFTVLIHQLQTLHLQDNLSDNVSTVGTLKHKSTKLCLKIFFVKGMLYNFIICLFNVIL